MPLLQVVPLVLILLVVPILIARLKSGISTWFPAQILGLFGIVAGIVLRENGVLSPLGQQLPLLLPILGVLASQVIAYLALK